MPKTLTISQEGSITDGRGTLTRIYDKLRKKDYRDCINDFWGAVDDEHRWYVRGLKDALNTVWKEAQW